jgi:RNA-directed DNA polymerase
MLLERIAQELGLPQPFLLSLAKTASFRYKTYYILKRHGGSREINHPAKPLKAVQRWILQNILSKLPVHEAAMAYRHGIGVKDNAKIHSDSRYLLRMDFEDFFPSITDKDIRQYIAKLPTFFSGWNDTDIEIFCRFLCRRHVLTIGAPTSPSLSNAICWDLDEQLMTISAQSQCRYTRYADDLFFSTTLPNVLKGLESVVIDVCNLLTIPARLVINSEKTRHSSKRGRRRVTGIVLSSDGTTRAGRDLKRKIRALVFRYQQIDYKTKVRLAGHVSYVASVDPEFINSLIKKYGPTLIAQVRKPSAG